MCSQRVRVLFFLFFVAASADFATGLAGMVQFALNGKADRAGLRSLHDSPSFIDEPPLKILPTEIQPILPTEAIAQPCEFLEPPGSVIASAQREDQIKVCDGSRAGLPLARHDDHDHDGHEGGHGNTWSLIGHKIGALLVMVVITITGCIIPILLRRTKFFFRVMTYVNSFACGAFLGLAFFHLLPEALYLTESARLGFTVGHNWYNLLYPLCFFGFVLILLFEKVLLVGVQREVAVVGHCHGVNECVVVDMSSDFKRHHHHHDHHDKDCMEQSLQTADGVHVDSAEHTKSVSSSTGSFKAVHRFSAVTLLATLSLSIHSIFEGMVVGTFDDSMSVWVATVSICGHKWAAGFALAANCVKANVSHNAIWIYLTIFVLSSPLGVLMGIGVSASNYAFIGAVDSISLGAILYTGCELLFDEFGTSNRVRKELIKFSLLLVGALMVLGLYMAHVGAGSHAHGQIK